MEKILRAAKELFSNGLTATIQRYARLLDGAYQISNLEAGLGASEKMRGADIASMSCYGSKRSRDIAHRLKR